MCSLVGGVEEGEAHGLLWLDAVAWRVGRGLVGPRAGLSPLPRFTSEAPRARRLTAKQGREGSYESRLWWALSQPFVNWGLSWTPLRATGALVFPGGRHVPALVPFGGSPGGSPTP